MMEPSEVIECALTLDRIRQNGISYLNQFDALIDEGLESKQALSNVFDDMAYDIASRLYPTKYDMGFPDKLDVNRIRESIEIINAKYKQLFE